MNGNRLTGMGKELHTRIRSFFDTPIDSAASPLEISQAVLDEVERQVQPVGRGRRVFPFVGLVVRVQTTPASSPAMALAFADFAARGAQRLAEVRCDPPGPLDVRLDCLDEAPDGWPTGQVFDVTWVAGVPAVPAVTSHGAGTPAVAAPPVLLVTVLAGSAENSPCRFVEGAVSIGRSTDPTDEVGRVRRNRLAFLDIADGVNETVGRAHARLRSDAVTREVRLFDEGSRNGTAILRDGEVIVVHRRDPRGVRVRSGDEVRLGRALVRIDIEA